MRPDSAGRAAGAVHLRRRQCRGPDARSPMLGAKSRCGRRSRWPAAARAARRSGCPTWYTTSAPPCTLVVSSALFHSLHLERFGLHRSTDGAAPPPARREGLVSTGAPPDRIVSAAGAAQADSQAVVHFSVVQTLGRLEPPAAPAIPDMSRRLLTHMPSCPAPRHGPSARSDQSRQRKRYGRRSGTRRRWYGRRGRSRARTLPSPW